MIFFLVNSVISSLNITNCFGYIIVFRIVGVAIRVFVWFRFGSGIQNILKGTIWIYMIVRFSLVPFNSVQFGLVLWWIDLLCPTPTNWNQSVTTKHSSTVYLLKRGSNSIFLQLRITCQIAWFAKAYCRAIRMKTSHMSV